MATLHILRTSGFNDNNLSLLINTCHDQDALVLLDDGCYNIHHPELINIKGKILALASHIQARAIESNQHPIELIDIDNLVTLTFKYQRVITWQ